MLPPLKVLLAEDALVNQRLAVRILEKAGHRVQVAVNGKEVLESLGRETFDLVLMDVQMPELGGYETTEKIRERERDTDHHVPIIALTAHAMKGDREKCLQVGMDNYVAKPIRGRELFSAMEQVLRQFRPDLIAGRDGAPRSPDDANREEGTSMAQVFDQAAALERCGDDPQLLRELIDMFLNESVTWMNGLADAIKAGSSDQIIRLAHTIKGAVGTFGAGPAYDAALRLEILGKEVNLDELGPAWEEMQVTIQELKEALAAFEA